jgi:hypothetical protein
MRSEHNSGQNLCINIWILSEWLVIDLKYKKMKQISKEKLIELWIKSNPFWLNS